MRELELYIHIPFCIKKCAYCDFLSYPSNDKDKQEYVDALLLEIEGCDRTYGKEYQVTSIFLGGGTPSILSGEQMTAVFETVKKHFSILPNAEITIEVNPGTVTREKVSAWKAAGINRLSIGLQSADDKELQLLGRVHTYQEFLETYELARNAEFLNINVDLISAIPGQTKASWKETLTVVAELEPEHISAYSLIVEEGTPFYERYGNSGSCCISQNDNTSIIPALPDETTERVIYELTAAVLEQYGYKRYEISNYAKAGYECRHNLGYWERKEYLGLGLGAASFIGNTRFHNTADMQLYLEGIYGNKEIREEIEVLDNAEEMEEFMFLGLRKTEGVSAQIFERTFGINIFEVYGDAFNKLEKEELLYIEGNQIFLTKRGVDVSNVVFLEFLNPVLF